MHIIRGMDISGIMHISELKYSPVKNVCDISRTYTVSTDVQTCCHLVCVLLTDSDPDSGQLSFRTVSLIRRKFIIPTSKHNCM